MFAILIPAYEPDERLVELVADLPQAPVLVVDDGSGPAYQQIFAAVAARGATVLTHASNRGKGAALRTGFAHTSAQFPGYAVVTADCDGQHAAADVATVAAAVEEHEGRVLVLGCRAFTGEVPARSRFGNTATRWVFRAVAMRDIPDTQTGLRGLSADTLEWACSLPGDRFEYEFRMLLEAGRAEIDIVSVPSQTIYTDGNASSHFRPLRDSARIYASLPKFAASGLLAFGIDTIALLALYAVTGQLLLSVVGARLISASVNFAVNRRLVFRRGREVSVRTAALRYGGLAVILLAANYGLLDALTGVGISLLAAKIVTEATLFIASYAMQHSLVFMPDSAAAQPTPVDVCQHADDRATSPACWHTSKSRGAVQT